MFYELTRFIHKKVEIISIKADNYALSGFVSNYVTGSGNVGTFLID